MSRFRPSRLGIVGLYEYADQEFGVEDGRLALRGRNTSGKSKALELLVPFVLDGDITPRKLDPFASSAKTMRWNLIECTDHYEQRRANKRIGYVWAEFERDGEYLTCGIGLEATRSTDGVRGRWYFTTPQRIGAGLELTLSDLEGDAQPISRSALAEQLERGGGALHDGPTAYKEALRAQLLPFATAPLYEQTLEVIRLLRKPKLSDSLNVTGLSKMLSGALPPVDEALVRRLGDALEQLHELQRQHDELREAHAEVASITEREYRAYARGVVAVRAERLRHGESGHERARSGVRARTEELAAAGLDRDVQDQTRAELERAYTRADTEHLSLVQSDAFKVIAVLEERTAQRDGARERLTGRTGAMEAAEHRLTRAREALAGAEQRAAASAQEATRRAAVLAELLRALGVDGGELPDATLRAMPGRLAVRQQDLERAGLLLAAVDEAAAALRAVAEPLARADGRREQAAAASAELAAQLEQAQEAQLDALAAWRRALAELRVDDADLDTLADATLDEDGDPLTILRALATPRQETLRLKSARLAAAREQAAGAVAERTDAVAALESTTDPQPAPRAVRPPDRAGRAGAPLWAACDFRPELDARSRADLEAALEDAGLLDAWISPDGTVHEGDVTLLSTTDGPTAPSQGTLADLLLPDAECTGLPAGLVAGILRGLPLDGAVSVAPGRFRLGPLHGRSAKPEPQFIGAAARAARREQLLAEARAALRSAQQKADRLSAEAAQLEAATGRLEQECARLPGTEALRAAQRGRRRAAERLEGAEAELREQLAEREAIELGHREARAALGEHGRATGLPVERDGLRSAEQAMTRAEHELDRLLEGRAAAAEASAALEAQRDAEGREVDGHGVAAAELAEATIELDTAEGRLRAAQAADGATAEELQARAAALRAERERLAVACRAAEEDQRVARDTLKDAEAAAGRAEDALQAAETERVGALDGVRAFGRHDLLSAALGSEAPPDERSSPEWTLTTALERVRALGELDLQVDLARRASNVGKAVSRLQRKLSAFDMNAATYHADDITLVEITREGRRATPTGMLAELRGDLDHREQILSAKRREVLGRALLGETPSTCARRSPGCVRRSGRATTRCAAARPAPGAR